MKLSVNTENFSYSFLLTNQNTKYPAKTCANAANDKITMIIRKGSISQGEITKIKIMS